MKFGLYTPRIFISAATSDLGSTRLRIKETVSKMECLAEVQEVFGPDWRKIESMLRDKIAKCDAIIHIAGVRYGSGPSSDSLPPGQAPKSYTQLEFDIARELGIERIYVYVCDEKYPFDTDDSDGKPLEEEESEKQILQEQHRERLLEREEIRYPIDSPDKLEKEILRIQIQLDALREEVQQVSNLAEGLTRDVASISETLDKTPERIEAILRMLFREWVDESEFGQRDKQLDKTIIPGASPTSILATRSTRNRSRMLNLVWRYWIDGILIPALHAEEGFEIELQLAPNSVLRHYELGDFQLPSTFGIESAFEGLNREILILGEPGSGKTILLLQLAKTLVERARQCAEASTPIALDLLSWSARPKARREEPFGIWVSEEVARHYKISRSIANAFVARENIVLLLDGLDEIPIEYRENCVEAINAFRNLRPGIGFAICSRVADYDNLNAKLDLRTALVLQPLNDNQIAAQIDGPSFSGLRKTLDRDEELRELARIPFLLNAMSHAYANCSSATLALPRDCSIAARRNHLLASFVDKQIQRDSLGYCPLVFRRVLGWLARRMERTGRLTFSLEDLQGTDLPHPVDRAKFAQTARTLSGGFVLSIALPMMMLAVISLMLLSGNNPFGDSTPILFVFTTAIVMAITSVVGFLFGAVVSWFVGVSGATFILLTGEVDTWHARGRGLFRLIRLNYFPSTAFAAIFSYGTTTLIASQVTGYVPSGGIPPDKAGFTVGIFASIAFVVFITLSLSSLLVMLIPSLIVGTFVNRKGNYGPMDFFLYGSLSAALFALFFQLDFYGDNMSGQPVFLIKTALVGAVLLISSLAGLLYLWVSSVDEKISVADEIGVGWRWKGFATGFAPVFLFLAGMITLIFVAPDLARIGLEKIGNDDSLFQTDITLTDLYWGIAQAAIISALSGILGGLFGGTKRRVIPVLRTKANHALFKRIRQSFILTLSWSAIGSAVMPVLTFLFLISTVRFHSLWSSEHLPRVESVNWFLVAIAGFMIFGGIGLAFSGLRNIPNHYILRGFLKSKLRLPYFLPKFLSESTSRLLLYRSGGGYRFVHRYLREYFASEVFTDPPPPDQNRRTRRFHTATISIILAIAALVSWRAGVDAVKTIGQQAFLGVVYAQENESGMEIQRVIVGSTAEKIGLQSGDVIVAVNDEAVTGKSSFLIRLEVLRQGENVDITFVRDGVEMRGSATLTAKPRGEN